MSTEQPIREVSQFSQLVSVLDDIQETLGGKGVKANIVYVAFYSDGAGELRQASTGRVILQFEDVAEIAEFLAASPIERCMQAFESGD